MEAEGVTVSIVTAGTDVDMEAFAGCKGWGAGNGLTEQRCRHSAAATTARKTIQGTKRRNLCRDLYQRTFQGSE